MLDRKRGRAAGRMARQIWEQVGTTLVHQHRLHKSVQARSADCKTLQPRKWQMTAPQYDMACLQVVYGGQKDLRTHWPAMCTALASQGDWKNKSLFPCIAHPIGLKCPLSSPALLPPSALDSLLAFVPSRCACLFASKLISRCDAVRHGNKRQDDLAGESKCSSPAGEPQHQEGEMVPS